jgi:hypothetical protein
MEQKRPDRFGAVRSILCGRLRDHAQETLAQLGRRSLAPGGTPDGPPKRLLEAEMGITSLADVEVPTHVLWRDVVELAVEELLHTPERILTGDPLRFAHGRSLPCLALFGG